jgi:hypothetical protein
VGPVKKTQTTSVAGAVLTMRLKPYLTKMKYETLLNTEGAQKNFWGLGNDTWLLRTQPGTRLGYIFKEHTFLYQQNNPSLLFLKVIATEGKQKVNSDAQ